MHGGDVVVVTRPGEHAGVDADAAVTDVPGAVLTIRVADCAPVALVAPDAVGVVHAGWRGLAAGVVGNAVDALRRLTDAPVRAVVGPCIGPECYEFGAADLDRLAATFGDDVRAHTRQGAPALDLRRAVDLALAAAGVAEVEHVAVCTSCSGDHWSHRRSADDERQALVAWI